jgi:hypothetical protein
VIINSQGFLDLALIIFFERLIEVCPEYLGRLNMKRSHGEAGYGKWRNN